MDLRLEKARTIVKTAKLRRKGDAWLVPSQSGHGKGYVVTHTEAGYVCTCPDYENRRKNCKHILAVAIVITEEESRTERTEETKPDGTKTVTTVTVSKRTTYKQEWAAYNKAQTEEKATFLDLLHDLCKGVTAPPQHMGRPRIPLAERLFASIYKVYSTFSGRRFMTDLKEAQKKGYLSRLPHFNSIFTTLDDEGLTPLLQRLITVTSLPLVALEDTFAVDSSGFSSCRYVRWHDAKHGDEATSTDLLQKHDWLKLHLICGVKTNIVTGIEGPTVSPTTPRFSPCWWRTRGGTSP
jgi:hypothetical protein